MTYFHIETQFLAKNTACISSIHVAAHTFEPEDYHSLSKFWAEFFELET